MHEKNTADDLPVTTDNFAGDSRVTNDRTVIPAKAGIQKKCISLNQ